MDCNSDLHMEKMIEEFHASPIVVEEGRTRYILLSLYFPTHYLYIFNIIAILINTHY